MKQRTLRDQLKFLIPLVFLISVVILRLVDPLWLQDLRISGTGWLQRSNPREVPEVPVVIVDIDDETLARYGQWPWPRTQIAALVDRLTDSGAAAISLDMVFPEADRTSVAQWLSVVQASQLSQDVKLQLQTLPDHDEMLAESFERGPVVAGFVLKNEENQTRPMIKAGYAFGGDDPKNYTIRLAGAVSNLPILEKAAKGNGHFNMVADRDGIIRRVPLFIRIEETLYPSLLLEALRVAQGARSYGIKSSGASGVTSFGAQTGITQIKVGNLLIPTDGRGRMWLYDSGYQPKRWLPAWKVLETEFSSDAVAGKLVFIGTSASGLKDLRATPLNPVAAGVEVHAQLAEQILSGQYLQRPDWANGAEFIFLLVFGLLCILLLPRVGGLWCALGALAAIALAFGSSWYLFVHKQLLIDAWIPSFAVFAIYLPTSLMHYLFSESDRKQIRTAFSRYLSPQVVNQLADNPQKLQLGGESKDMTILFADIRGFTTVSESLDAQGVTKFINRFMTPMTHIILEKKGTIDKYMGDGLMAFWNAPITIENHAELACYAALQMQQELIELNKRLEEESQPHIGMGIGLNTGECCVGNLGSDLRFDYSVVGDAVNLGSRLEGQSKTYGVDIVIGEETYRQANSFACLELDIIRVKGKTKPVRIYTLLGAPEIKELSQFQRFDEVHKSFIEAYRNRQWEKSLELLELCEQKSKQYALKGLYGLYRERIGAFKETPPAKEWDGVYVATSK